MSILSYFQGADAISTGRVLVAIVKNCYEAKKWDLLNENIVLLTKRRGQLKQVYLSWYPLNSEGSPHLNKNFTWHEGYLRNLTCSSLYLTFWQSDWLTSRSKRFFLNPTVFHGRLALGRMWKLRLKHKFPLGFDWSFVFRKTYTWSWRKSSHYGFHEIQQISHEIQRISWNLADFMWNP